VGSGRPPCGEGREAEVASGRTSSGVCRCGVADGAIVSLRGPKVWSFARFGCNQPGPVPERYLDRGTLSSLLMAFPGTGNKGGHIDRICPMASILRRVGPPRAGDICLRTLVDWTEGRKGATARSADIREGVGYSRMQRGVCEYGIVPVERPMLSSRLTRERPSQHDEPCVAWPVGCSKLFGGPVTLLDRKTPRDILLAAGIKR
jgi:hypothetical protein